MATRVTRSMSSEQSQSQNATDSSQGQEPTISVANGCTPALSFSSSLRFPLPEPLTRKSTTLRPEDFEVLLAKQQKLRNLAGSLPDSLQDRRLRSTKRLSGIASDIKANDPLSQALAATLVFAQAEAGTAVCISSGGLMLTCAHCVAQSEKELRRGQDKWLLFSSGQIVRAKCTAWDSVRDLALLQITAAQQAPEASFLHIPVSRIEPRLSEKLLCIGQPGPEDLEAATPGETTGYDVLHVSHGRFRGLVADQDPQDNSEIGALMHDCWTYWGHSGAPLIQIRDGELVGLHSSWDDQTGMRRGVPLVAIRAFLADHAEDVMQL